MLRRHKRWWLVLGTMVIVVGLFATSLALAEPATPTAEGDTPDVSQDYRQVFIEKLASILGVDTAKLQDSIKQAGKATADEAVAKGELAQERADRVKQRIDEGDSGPFLGRPFGRDFGFKRHLEPMRGGFAGLMAFGNEVKEALADKLGITIAELGDELRAGRSLSDLAEDKGLSEQDLKAAVVAAVKTQLEQAVQDGKISQEQADNMIERIEQFELPMFGGLRFNRSLSHPCWGDEQP